MPLSTAAPPRNEKYPENLVTILPSTTSYGAPANFALANLLHKLICTIMADLILGFGATTFFDGIDKKCPSVIIFATKFYRVGKE